MIAPDALGRLPETPSQTAGPYLHIGLAPDQAGLPVFAAPLGRTVAGPEVAGARIRIEGRITDGDGALVRDALVEIWQADAEGCYPEPGSAFRGWGRTGTDFETGLWAFDTIRPGRVPGRRGHARMAPHINLWIVARGINIGLATRLYFADEAQANAEDPVLRLVGAERRGTLIASRRATGGEAACYGFDIRLQGEGETVFFDL
jgi:protocatechuate 3,4-dioxygenase alpha subunit